MKPWDEHLYLFTLAEYELLPDGFELACIDGTKQTKGKDYIDLDTRFGYIAYGINDPHNHPESELLTLIRLRLAGVKK